MPVPTPVAYSPTNALINVDVPPSGVNGVLGTYPTGLSATLGIDFEQSVNGGAFVALFTAILVPDTIQPAVSPGNTYQGRFVYHLSGGGTDTGPASVYYSLPATPPDQTPDVSAPNTAEFTKPTVLGALSYQLHYRLAGAGSYTVVYYSASTITLTLAAGVYEFRELVSGNSGVAFGNVQEFTVTDPPDLDATHCCPVGQYWNEVAGECQALPFLPDVPGPPILVTQDCAAGITLETPVWPTDTDYVQLRRVGETVVIHTWVSDVGADYVDATALTPDTYLYEVRACNAFGCSAWSTDLTVPTAATNLTVALSTDADDPASGTFTVIADVTEVGGTCADCIIYLNGTALATTQSDADPLQYYVEYDSIAGRVSGTLHFSAVAENSTGCKTAPDTLDIDVDNSLFASTRYRGLEEYDNPDATAIRKAGVWVRLNAALSTPADHYHEFYVISPRPTGLDYNDAAEMEAVILRSQAVRNPSVTRLDGARNADGTYVPPDETMLLIVKESPIEVWSEYDLTADNGAKLRWVSDENYLIVTTGPLKIQRFTDDLAEVVDFTDYGLEGGTDACYISTSEYHVIRNSRVYIVDGDAGEKTVAAVPVSSGVDDPGDILAVEAVGGKAYWIYTDEISTRAYSYEAGRTKLKFTIGAHATLAYAKGAVLLVVCGSKIYEWDTSDVSPAITLIATHSKDVAGVQIIDDRVAIDDEAGDAVTVFEDGDGGFFTIDGVSVLTDGDLAFSANARARFAGSNATIRGAVAGADEHVYLQDASGAFVAVADDATIFPDGAVIVDMAQHIRVAVLGVGDPLDGGTPTVFEESLIGLVDKPAAGGVWLFRYQATRPGDFAYRSQQIEDVVFMER